MPTYPNKPLDVADRDAIVAQGTAAFHAGAVRLAPVTSLMLMGGMNAVWSWYDGYDAANGIFDHSWRGEEINFALPGHEITVDTP